MFPSHDRSEERVRYSDAELQEFKKIIQDKIAKAEKDLALINESFINDQNIVTGKQIGRAHV